MAERTRNSMLKKIIIDFSINGKVDTQTVLTSIDLVDRFWNDLKQEPS